MIQIVKALGIGLKNKEGKIESFVSTDVFDKRKKQISCFANPFSNLHNDIKAYSTVVKKLEAKKNYGGYEIVLAEYVVTIDLSLIYKDGLAQINRVKGNSVDISLVGSDKQGYQCFNSDECIIIKEIKEFTNEIEETSLLVA